MVEKNVRILKRAFLVSIAVAISIWVCNYFNLSHFYAGIGALNVSDLMIRKLEDKLMKEL